MPFTNSPNMSLLLPGIGTEAAPTWAQDLNSSLSILDQHDHSSGKGVPITPSGLSITSDLSLQLNNLTSARSVRLSPLSLGSLTGADLGCLVESGVDLYYVDGNGNQIRLTASGGIAGTNGSIAGLTSPASASFSSGSATFTFQSNTSTPAIMSAGPYVMGKNSASSNTITITPPSGLASNYTFTLPAAPPASTTNPLFIDSSGNLSAPTNVTMPGTLSTSGSLTIGTSGAVITNNGTLAVLPNFQLGSVSQAQVQATTSNTISVAHSDGTSPQAVVVSANPNAAGLMILRAVVTITTDGVGHIASAVIAFGEGLAITSVSFSIGFTFNTAFADTPMILTQITPVSGTFPTAYPYYYPQSTTTTGFGFFTGGLQVPSITYQLNLLVVGQRT